MFTSYISKSEDVVLVAALYVQPNLARIIIRVECFFYMGIVVYVYVCGTKIDIAVNQY